VLALDVAVVASLPPPFAATLMPMITARAITEMKRFFFYQGRWAFAYALAAFASAFAAR